MIERTATIRNAAGIHCRPSAAIVKSLRGYGGQVDVVCGDSVCAPLSVMGLLELELQCGSTVTVRVTGDDEAATCDRVVELFESTFDFPPR